MLRTRARRLASAVLATGMVAGTLLSGVATTPPSAQAATTYVQIDGAGSSWAAVAVEQWVTDVRQFGMRVNFNADGSNQGRTDYLNHNVDFAVSDIPFQQDPKDGSAPEHPPAGSYAYMPIVAGGTSFMYHLTINGHRVTNLRLSGTAIADIFTGAVKFWDNPVIQSTNPDLKLPHEQIIPVVRSDGSGSSAQFSLWMIAQEQSIWNAYYKKLGKGSTGVETEFWPTTTGMIAQNGDLGVASYIEQNYGEGSIGYVEYSYALESGYPVALMLNKAGYFVEPTADNVAVALTKAQINMDKSNPAVYLTQSLSNVYDDTDPRAYPMSSYSYMILPTTVEGRFSTAKGTTLGAFSYYFMCQGQQQAPKLGYSPLPINLVEAGFQQILKIPGVVKQSITVSGCNNPTFDPGNPNDNHLADIAPFPPACDKVGPVQCTSGTGGAAAIITPVSGSAAKGTTGGSGTAASSGTAGATGSSASADPSSSAGPSGQAVNPDIGLPAGGAAAAGQPVNGQPVSLSGRTGWGAEQYLLVLVGLSLLALFFAPPLLHRYLGQQTGPGRKP